jgi:hypothetical protein
MMAGDESRTGVAFGEAVKKFHDREVKVATVATM